MSKLVFSGHLHFEVNLISRGIKVGKMLTLAPKILYGCKGNSMVYLKPLYRRLNRLAYRRRSHFSTEAQQEHVKILFSKMPYIFIKKDRD